MAYVSLGLDRNQPYAPDSVSVGTDDGGGGNNLTVSINKAVGITRFEAAEMLKAIIRRLEDGRFDDTLSV